MVASVFLVFVFCCSFLTETALSHGITKREAEQFSELKLENELRRVKKMMNTENDIKTLARVKRTKRGENLEKELTRMKRMKRSSIEQELSRVKRTRQADNFVSPDLARVKRFKDFDVDSPRLSRVKRREILLPEPDLSRIKRTKRSVEYVSPELSRVKRFEDPSTVELTRVKRLKRAVLESATNLVRNRRAKRIPPDLHRLKRIRINQKMGHRTRSSAEKFANHKRKLNNMKESRRQHFHELHGKKYNIDEDIDLASAKRAMSRDAGVKRQNTLKNVGNMKQRVRQRLRQRHNKLHKNRMNHHSHRSNAKRVKPDKNSKHHVQSHKLSNKNV